MLKKICGLFLGLVVLTGSACVTPTHASSAPSVILTHVQAASASSAKDEMVSIYNNSPNGVDITNWCIKNKANICFAGFMVENVGEWYYLPPYSYAVAVSESYANSNPSSLVNVTNVYAVTSQTSGSIVNSSDTISLVDATGQTIDQMSWSTAIPSGKVMIRTKTGSDPRIYETLDTTLAWGAGTLSQLPVGKTQLRTTPVTEPEIPDTPTDPNEPTNPTNPSTNNPDTSNSENPSNPPQIHPIITEILPDAKGSDTGNEFIELYNPGTTSINLSDYKVRVGVNLEKTYGFPTGAVLLPESYQSYTNGQIAFTLLNSSSSVQLEYKGQLISEPVTYNNPKEGESWALIEGEWKYTSLPTPSIENTASVSTSESETEAPESTQKPCAANQYRSPETNRCRLITTASTSTPKPCEAGQERNPDTNRCRTIAADSSTKAPCKEGQERNPETNRCKNIVKMTNANYAVKGASTEQAPVNWYLWLGIAGVVALILGYAIWEWREEIKTLITTIRQKFARTK